MSSNPFTLDDGSYKRTINPLVHYVDQVSAYLAKSTGKDKTTCVAFVKEKIKDGNTFPNIRDPQIRYYERQDNGDRIEVESTLLNYINAALANQELIAPTLTTYLNTKQKESLLVSYIDSNVKGRAKAKKEMFAAKAAKQEELAKIKNTEQTNRKLSNNAISGAHVSNSTPLANKTAHSTLTSNCRSTSGYGNANNEKLLNGNRHYWNAYVTLNNIVSIVTHTDLEKLRLVIHKYNLYMPSARDAMECIERSSDLYWRNIEMSIHIRNFLDTLSPIELAAFVYVGDLYNLMKFNDSLMREFIGKLSDKITEGEIENPLAYVEKANEDYMNLAHQICSDEMKGAGKKYKELSADKLKTLALTARNIDVVLQEYFDLIQALLVTDNMPASVAYFPESVRHAALTSDTDSTIFTVQDWVMWFKQAKEFGPDLFDSRSMSVAATMIFLASQSITHILAMMSANFGIEQKRLKQVAMKNEFKFDVFVPTNVAKHYYALISCQEGNVFDEPEFEIKGVHLKSSNSPKAVTKKAAEMMEEILESIKKGSTLNLQKFLTEIADVERNIINSIRGGDLQYFRLGEIKNADSYTKDKEESPYAQYILWLETMADKYGTYSPPPYQTVKISTTLTNPTLTREWLDSIEDKALAERFKTWFAKNDRKVLPSILLPVEAVTVHGIPKEIMDIINIRKVVYDLCKIFYLILETLGYYICNDKMTKLVSDFY